MTDPMIALNPAEEEAYLASLLTSSTARTLREDALGKVSPEYFWNGRYGGLWATAQKLYAADKPINHRSLVANADSPPASVDQMLWNLSQTVPEPSLYPDALAEVQRCGRMRRLYASLQRAMQRAASADEYSMALSAAFEELAKLDEATGSAQSQRFDALLGQFEVAMKDHTQYRIIETPWPELNKHIAGGLHAGRFYVVGARPGQGKSIAAHNIAEHAAGNGFASLVFSVEMGALEVTGRMVANAASIEMGEISRRDLSEYSWHRFHQYRDTAQNHELFIDETPDLSIGYVRSEASSRKRKTGLDVVVVDYAQLVKGDAKAPREQQMAGISRALKQLSRELDVAVVVPAQLNRGSEQRPDKRPVLSDLRESGSFEQDADVVMMLARQFSDDGDMKSVPNGLVSVELPKNRQGQVASFELPFRGHYSRIG